MATELMTQEDALPVASDGGEGVSSLVRLAIERGVDVEVLERLVALQERVTERNARAAFFEAVANFQEECPEIRKVKNAEITSKRTGGKFSYTFAPLEEIARTIRPVLKRHGLSYSWNVAPGDGGLIVTCILRHVEGHSESADFPVPNDGDGRMSAAQANGAALTYGKRQSLTSVLGLTTADEDKDGARRPAPQAKEITMQQADAIDNLLTITESDREKFFEWLGVESIADMTEDHYKRGVKALTDKKGRKG